MVTRQTATATRAGAGTRPLQWRPGMVTRQTTKRSSYHADHPVASMEAGNGYPANLLSQYAPPPHPSRFNGGREWLPGKHAAAEYGGCEGLVLQWRPGMVTRQTCGALHLSGEQNRLQWRPGMVTRQTTPTPTSTPAAIRLQWRPGMVTRQTGRDDTLTIMQHCASMEAGNGYPANMGAPWLVGVLSTSFNGGREWLPGKRRRRLRAGDRPPGFNGGREWLPGKPVCQHAL